MKYVTSLEEVLSRTMTRKEFLVYCATVLLLVSGISGVLKALSHASTASKPVSTGFGSRSYGS